MHSHLSYWQNPKTLTSYFGKTLGNRYSHNLMMGMQNGITPMQGTWQHPAKYHTHYPLTQPSHFQDSPQKHWQRYKDTCTRLFISALFETAKIWIQTKGPQWGLVELTTVYPALRHSRQQQKQIRILFGLCICVLHSSPDILHP